MNEINEINNMGNELIDELLKFRRRLGRSESTIRVMIDAFNRASKYMELDIEGLKKITQEEAQEIILSMSDNYVNSTVKLTKVYINKLYKFAKIKTPFIDMEYTIEKRDSDKDTITFFEIDEVKRILKSAEEQINKHSNRDVAMLSLMFNGGVRKSEVLKLNRNDVDLKKNEIRLLNTKKETKAVIQVGEHVIVLIEKYLKTRKDKLEPLFISSYKSRISSSGIDKIVKNVYKLANVEGDIHKTRRTTASLMADQGFSTYDIKERLRHKSTQTTDRYISQSKKRKTNVANNLGF